MRASACGALRREQVDDDLLAAQHGADLRVLEPARDEVLAEQGEQFVGADRRVGGGGRCARAASSVCASRAAIRTDATPIELRRDAAVGVLSAATPFVPATISSKLGSESGSVPLPPASSATSWSAAWLPTECGADAPLPVRVPGRG
ncbi:hypothetical protein ACFQZK_25070 [Rhodococcus aetherivorans]